ncbi:similar to Saccharomyces cerevisiae YML068W ITT1 Protein that modulates the efficiency of translation termination [Maudiozyma saulgeensis]|uniref:RBR-type E3 ubiquitin transferase n=1 Tax=Maudiozyma saulgeensis TaxID=1789683 RepID=A0A1X7QZB9_9SACH|nr:similar to Saccharomyces cerevisiae YML068W ITT1 Protein that modulates the efficiency of translation termination [Kazachstania saulgeensis]
MIDVTKIKEDLQILESMFPEVQIFPAVELITERTRSIRGRLHFDMFTSSEDLAVYFNEESIMLTKLPGNTLRFNIDIIEYPSFKNCMELKLQSNYLPQDKINLYFRTLHKEFDDMTDVLSEKYEPDTPLMMLLFNHLMYDSIDMIFPNHKIICTSDTDFLLYTGILHEIKQDTYNKSNYDCCICIETKKGKDMTELPCGKDHRLCSSCIVSYYSKLIKDGHITSVRCPECEYRELYLNDYTDYKTMVKDIFTPAIPFQFFRGILPDDLCERYENLFHSQSAVKLSKHSPYSCVTCRKCDTWCVKVDLDEPMMRCHKCESTFCFDCLHSWHGYNNKCGSKATLPSDVLEDYIDVRDTDSDRKKKLISAYGLKILEKETSNYLAEKMLDIAISAEGSDLQRCPKCRVVVQRSEGCNRMRCGICSTVFCYLCGNSLFSDDSYEHFKEKYSPCYGRLFEGMPGTED